MNKICYQHVPVLTGKTNQRMQDSGTESLEEGANVTDICTSVVRFRFSIVRDACAEFRQL